MPLLPQPVRKLTGWAKAVAISAISLLLSLGLCGANYAAYVVEGPSPTGMVVPGRTHEAQQHWANILFITAGVEVVAIGVSALVLFISLVGLLVTRFKRRTQPG